MLSTTGSNTTPVRPPQTASSKEITEALTAEREAEK